MYWKQPLYTQSGSDFALALYIVCIIFIMNQIIKFQNMWSVKQSMCVLVVANIIHDAYRTFL